MAICMRMHTDYWQLILGLSAPEGWSVNNGIDPTLCSFLYVKIDQEYLQ